MKIVYQECEAYQSSPDLLDYACNEAVKRVERMHSGLMQLYAWPYLYNHKESSTLELLYTGKEGMKRSEKPKQRPDWKNMGN